tara:strand:- start:49 stop:324 length:276 start_codon:yes stop_codon:yes gene_type:complete
MTTVEQTKQYRKDLDAVLQRIKEGSEKSSVTKDTVQVIRHSRERSLAITKVQEAIMWLGMDLKEQGTDNPYPNSYKPENQIIDKTADGLKL